MKRLLICCIYHPWINTHDRHFDPVRATTSLLFWRLEDKTSTCPSLANGCLTTSNQMWFVDFAYLLVDSGVRIDFECCPTSHPWFSFFLGSGNSDWRSGYCGCCCKAWPLITTCRVCTWVMCKFWFKRTCSIHDFVAPSSSSIVTWITIDWWIHRLVVW